VAFVVRQFPLEAIHPFARSAARASECAGAQGRFFPYYDLLFRHQARLRTRDLELDARTAVVPDTAAFDRCLRGSTVDRRIDADLAAGAVAGVTSTPTFFVNGIKLTGAQPYPAFKAALDQALSK
jgi:protein-disulfide isomerase